MKLPGPPQALLDWKQKYQRSQRKDAHQFTKKEQPA